METFITFGNNIAPDQGGEEDADWVARSTASGVEKYTRLETQAELNDWVHAAEAANVTLDTSIKVSGALGSFRFAVQSADSASSGLISVPIGRTFTDGDTVWWSFRMQMSDAVAYARWCANRSTGMKFFILSRDVHGAGDQGSNQVNEIVGQDNDNDGLISGYWQNGTVSAVYPLVDLATDCNGSDYWLQPKINYNVSDLDSVYPLTGTNPDDGSTWTECEQDRRQYPLYSSRSQPEYAPGLGDPFAKGVRKISDEFGTVTCRLAIGTMNGSATNTRWSMWFARLELPYVLIHDAQGITLGNGPDFNGLNLPAYVSHRSPGGRKVTSGSMSGVSIIAVGPSTHTGVGKLEHNATTGRFRFHASNDSYGTARGYSVSNGITKINLHSSTNGVSTTTAAQVTLPQASITLTSAASFPTSGSIALGDPDTSQAGSISHGDGEQYITYTGKSGNVLTGCSGGTGTHEAGALVSIASHISIRIDDAGALPGGTTEVDITIGEGRAEGYWWVNDLIISTQSINAVGGHAPAGVSTLADAAAALSSGQWGSVTCSSLTTSLTTNGDSDGILSYVRPAHWDSIAKRGYFYGSTHGGLYYNRIIRYIDATNTWEVDSNCAPEGCGLDNNPAYHGWSHFALRPSDGRQFIRHYGSSTVSTRLPGESWTTIQSLPGSLFVDWNVANVLIYFPDFNSGAGGLIFVGTDTVYGSNSTFTSWSELHHEEGMNVNGNVGCYDPSTQCVFFGGGTGSLKHWRVSANGTVTQRADFPFGVGVDGGQGCGGYYRSTGTTNKPFAIRTSNNDIQEYNNATNTWASVSTLPFAASEDQYFAFPVDEYGCVCFVWNVGNSLTPSTTMYVWKR